MASPLIEKELLDYLVTNVTDLTSSNSFIGILPGTSGGNGVPVKAAVIFSNGGETVRRKRIRLMTRGADPEETMFLANDIYDQLQRLNNCPLTTYRIYMVTGQRPQHSGRSEAGEFLTSSDYLIEFELI